MKQYILKNDTQENVSARVTVTPSDELNNLGHEGATVIEGDRLTTCLSPTVNEMLPPVSHRSDCFELPEEGRYAVEINGVIVPFAFTATDLLDCFNGTHESGVQFKPCAVKPEISCAGATNQAFLTDGSGVWDVELNGELFVNPGDMGAGYFVMQTPELASEIEIGGDGNAVIVSLNATKFNRVRLFPRDSARWAIDTESNENPTLAVESNGVISVCLSPVAREISCDGALPLFAAKASFEANVIEVQVNDGPWTSIGEVTELNIGFRPGNPGADLTFELIDEDTRTVRLRTTRDIGLYVNPQTDIDQIGSNAAYVLYDRDGNVIDTDLESNWDYSGREFDDTSTDEDYAVFFATAEFCLSPLQPSFELPFLEYQNNPTASFLFSKLSLEFNGKVYTGYWLNFSTDIRSPLLSLLSGEFKSADGEVITPIGTDVGYVDVYNKPRHFKLHDNKQTGNITISGFSDNSLLPNCTFEESFATLKFVVTPADAAPPPEQPERDWMDLIEVYGAPNFGTIHHGIEIISLGTLTAPPEV